MRKAVFITVRTDSTRLPNKALKEILGIPTIELVILRAKQVKGVDAVQSLISPDEACRRSVVAIADRNGINWHRGSVEDKLDRWLGATKKYSIDCFVTMDGDDLLCDPELIGLAIDQMESGTVDFIRAPRDLICGSFTYCLKSSALQKVCDVKDTNDTEMMWTYFEDTGLFAVADLDVSDLVFFSREIRLTLDYQEDFEFFSRIFEHFQAKKNDVPLRDIVQFLSGHPEIVAINAFRQKDFRENQKRKTKLVIKKPVK
jgi:spore coat polysaccharide biosynthesis protein SpsF (cytidylyltransferase family)